MTSQAIDLHAMDEGFDPASDGPRLPRRWHERGSFRADAPSGRPGRVAPLGGAPGG